VSPLDQSQAEGDEVLDYDPQHVRKAEQEVADPFQHFIAAPDRAWMILLVVGHLAVTVGAKEDGGGIAAAASDMVTFEAAPVGFAACATACAD
jgi:hypothetical protein